MSDSTTTEDATIRPIRLAHVVLRTHERYDEMCQWYQDALGAWVVHQDPMFCFLTFDDEHHRIAIANIPQMGERPSGTVGLEHIAFTYGSLADLFGTYRALKGRGVEPLVSINHGPTTSLYYEDPDRNRIELQVENFDTAEEINAFMQSDVMMVNPVGVAFDPEEAIGKLRDGVDEEELKAYPMPPQPFDPSVLETLSRN